MSTEDLPLTDGAVEFAGAVSLDINDAGVLPWRLPVAERSFYEDILCSRASTGSGVRISLVSDTESLALDIEPVTDWEADNFDPEWTFDLLVDNELHERVRQPCTDGVIRFANLPAGPHRLEAHLPQFCPARVRRVTIDAGAFAEGWRDPRPRWIVYGSSITHCRAAAGPSETWPALVAKSFDLNLTCLGFGGNCHLEPMVARVIRDRPADYIGIKAGINIMAAGSLSVRTFRSAVVGFVQIIRERHVNTPIALVSSIVAPAYENTPNPGGLTLRLMREQMAEVVETLRGCGDQHLHYFNGLELFGEDQLDFMPDQVHPNAEGYRRLAERYAELVMPTLLADA